MESSQPQPLSRLAHPSPSPSFRLHSPSLNTLRLRRVFDLFDRNSDGEITSDELHSALDCLGLGADPADIASIISSHVQPGCNGLRFEEFQDLHRTLGDALFGDCLDDNQEAEEEDMVEAFKVFDVDGDGFISAKELQTVLGKLGLEEGQSLDRVHQMICSVDRNCDGRVDFREFKHMMEGITVNGC